MISIQHLQPTAAPDETGEPLQAIKAAEITIRGRPIGGAEEKALAAAGSLGLRIFGTRSCLFGDTEMVLLVVSDVDPARLALETMGLECRSITSVVAVPVSNADTKAAVMARLMRAGIRVLYCYSLSPDTGGDCLVVRTVDNELSARLLSDAAMAQAA
ncbi:MAG: hypothetical protein HZA91_07840 [Verrucomicrobia bacterium]|nr:hypothetical protein [Verrucomicrobiota bacterium]